MGFWGHLFKTGEKALPETDESNFEERLKGKRHEKIYNLQFTIIIIAVALATAAPAIAPWEDLRDILRDAQLSLLPSETPVVHDLGTLLLLPGGTLLPVDTPSPPEAFLANLPFTIYHLSLFEDPDTHATVFLDGDGSLLHELPAEEGYSPAWVYNAIYNLQLIIDNSPSPSFFDPSLVTLTATLSDPFGLLFEGVQESGSPEGEQCGTGMFFCPYSDRKTTCVLE